MPGSLAFDGGGIFLIFFALNLFPAGRYIPYEPDGCGIFVSIAIFVKGIALPANRAGSRNP